ncbi:hypothetical protein NDU88_002135 [Pleurodeles waltl]|uniref:Uncharacterized protein n=1 Tax=Pleurodeles waltl TaxID=8319 RepID=A0AAV7KY24_PLEWA|nr:hypothetical protein NDU88_002135 [Pleurodeles waltl]
MPDREVAVANGSPIACSFESDGQNTEDLPDNGAPSLGPKVCVFVWVKEECCVHREHAHDAHSGKGYV